MKVLIIEDELPAAKRLKSVLKEVDPSIEIIDIIDSISRAVKRIEAGQQPDIIFMDIQLSDGLSFEIFKRVEIKCPVIFTTAFDEYAIQAFKVNSIDYLLKPIEAVHLRNSLKKYEELKKQFSAESETGYLKKFLETITQNKKIFKTRFLVKSGQSFIRMGAEECAYFFLENKLTYLVHFNGKKHLVDFTLDELEKQLDPQIFCRANRQFIVNIESIISVHYFFRGKLKLRLKPETSESIIVSREKAPLFKKWMES
ncbi:MAG: LytTR family DNA-binding domain-containing protein [Ignavibacteria bacterium]|jgi:DNA-binding LytR/AlgR family response regulator